MLSATTERHERGKVPSWDGTLGYKLHVVISEYLLLSVLIGKQEVILEEEIDQLFCSHYKNLQTFLLASNGNEIFKKYRKRPNLFTVKCAEYTYELQMKVLNIDLSTIKQPLLDIGCGEQQILFSF